MTENSKLSTPCPGAELGLAFDNLKPGQNYAVTLAGGLSFTRASSKTGDIPSGVAFAGNRASFMAPAAVVSFTLGVKVSGDEVSLSTSLAGEEQVSVSLLSGGARGQGALTFRPYEADLPPTCVILNPRVPSCPVCAMDTSKCPEASAIGESQFCMGQHIFLCCVECPGSQTDSPD